MAGIRLQPLATESPEELRRLIHRPGGPPGTPSPESSTSARGPSSAPARGPPLQRRLSEGAGRASPEPGPRGVGLRFERAIQTENPKTKPRGDVIFLVFQQGFLSLGLKTLGGARRQRYRHSPGYLLLVTLLKLQGGMSVAHTAGHLLLTLLLTEAGKTLGNLASPGCQVQGSVNTKPFLQYDSDSNKVKPLGFLGKEVNDTKVWTELSQTLAEAGKELRMVLPFIKLDKKEMRAEQCSGASLHFSLNGRTALLLDTMSVTWTVIDPGATGIKEEWENNQELAEYFRTISTGDCSYWLREFLKHWENMLLPESTEPLIMAPDISQSASIRLVACIILLIITQLVLIASSS
ncbi:hypothetical protein MJT46_008717 [Ovis ammon polii x Ovis aries]|nr:hypothetical protein MJT46_008717 [Ovis ammon polii x Ovis aries]